MTSSSPSPQLSETLAPLTHPGGSRPEFLGNLMRRLTLSAPQNYLGPLHLALLCLSGFNRSIQLVCLFGLSSILAATRLIQEFHHISLTFAMKY
jgi:hypothetical protein